MKTLSVIFWILAVLLSDVMCAVVAWNYCYLKYVPYNSAPTETAFFLAIPYAVGIAVCVALALFFKHRAA